MWLYNGGILVAVASGTVSSNVSMDVEVRKDRTVTARYSSCGRVSTTPNDKKL